MTTVSVFPPLQDQAEPGLWKAIVLALGVHILLICVLIMGLHWQRFQSNSIDMELWNAPSDLVEDTNPHVQPMQDNAAASSAAAASEAQDIALENKTTTVKKKDRTAETSENLTEETHHRHAELPENKMPEIGQDGSVAASSDEGQGKREAQPWKDRVKNRIAFNATYEVSSEEREGGVAVEFAVKLRANGTIADIQLLKSSGNAQFDEAVRMGIVKSQPFPVDAPGTVPPEFDSKILPVDVDFVHRFPERANVR